LALTACLLPSTPALAWTPATQVKIAEEAAAVAPPDLKRQIDRYLPELRRGSVEPYRNGDASTHFKNPAGGGRLDEVILSETERAIRFIRSHRPFKDIVYQLGVLSHFVADANNPLSTAEADPREPSYFADYLRYVETAQDRFSVVFYGDGRDLEGPDAIAPLMSRTLARSRHLYPSIGEEYRRVGGPPGAPHFDDRSVAFGVASLTFSHAVSDVAALFRYIWIEAGGADQRQLPLSEPTPPDSRKP
jgi:hypothetical protein